MTKRWITDILFYFLIIMFDKLCGLSSSKVVCTIEDNTTGSVIDLTANDCVVKSVDVHIDADPSDCIDILGGIPIKRPKPIGLATFNISFVTSANKFEQSFFDKEKLIIKDKKVDDCTIQELLFAVRQKIR